MKLQTQIPLHKAANQIDYDSRLVLLGSCFVENIGRKLDYFKFRQLQNPYGIHFHPLAIEQLISGAVREESYTETDTFYLNGLWHCFDAHSDLSDPSQVSLLKKLNEGLQATQKSLTIASHIIITLGTAWVYRHLEFGGIVANCHKVPQKAFSKELMAIPEIIKSLERIGKLIKTVNADVQLVFTISPVRHLKDGFIENQRSKAYLITAVQQFCTTSEAVKTNMHRTEVNLGENRQVAYFPSYEIMMDELRDYRFYGRDMVHPNELAIDYIWEKFKTIWISEESYPTMEQVATIQKGLRHRPFQPDSSEHTNFLGLLETKIATIQRVYPFMKF